MTDRLGCYRVGDLKFYSKLEAIEMHSHTDIHPHWDFNEQIFSSIDWTTEPNENLLDLYRQRAQQLRDQYDYIVLWYSGGADSHTVLESFLLNDIKIDEIVTFNNYSGSSNKDDFMNAEVFRVAIPTVQKLVDDYPWLKYRLIDLAEHTVNVFQEKDSKFDWIYNLNMCFSPNHMARDGLVFKIKEWADVIHSGKKFCFLWGHDKPRIFHENNRFSFRFIDLIDNGPNVKSFAGQLPYADELFFWTPDLPKIVVKQAHMIKNYLNQNLLTSQYISNTRSDLAYKTHSNGKKWLNVHGVHSVVYPNYYLDTFTSGKPGSIITSPRDSWFFQLEETSLSKKIWKMGVDKMFKIIPDYWKNDPIDISKGIKACWSKDYYLE